MDISTQIEDYLAKKHAPQWIPAIQGSLPEEYEPVVVFYTYWLELDDDSGLGGAIGVTYLVNARPTVKFPDGRWKDIGDNGITVHYWQPQPEFPKEFRHLK